MTQTFRRFAAGVALAIAVSIAVGAGSAAAVRAQSVAAKAPLPDHLSDADFWRLESDVSEPGGYFRIADNFTSNEGEIGRVFTDLQATGVKGGVYMGVGPEQNLTYMAAIHPAMAFIVDIRRQAVMQHLMFKAIFDLSHDRADFISLLFSLPKPAGLAATAPIDQLWNAFLTVRTDTEMAGKTRALIVERLTRTHGFTLTPDEIAQVEFVFDAFTRYGPGITTSSGGRGGGNALTFADLTGWSADSTGKTRSFLMDEDAFQTVKALEDKNLVIPVSGDFGGTKAIRAIAAYLNVHDAPVSAFYLSNVEQYLFMDGKETAFYDNVRALPLTPASVFIRPYSLRPPANTSGLCPMVRFLAAAKNGQVPTNNSALVCPQR